MGCAIAVKLTPEQLRDLLAKPDYAARNVDLLEVQRKAQSAQPECAVCDAPVGEAQGESKNAGRVRVWIESRRARLLDPDNLAAKYFVDSLRYAGLIPNDRTEDIELKVTQKKVKKGEEETVIELERIP
jgi:hypothetical protein